MEALKQEVEDKKSQFEAQIQLQATKITETTNMLKEKMIQIKELRIQIDEHIRENNLQKYIHEDELEDLNQII